MLKMDEKKLLDWYMSNPQPLRRSILEKLTRLWNNDELRLKDLLDEKDDQTLNNPKCKKCHSSETIRRGKIKGIQRYSCKACKKYWMATDGTSLAGIKKKELWGEYLKAFDRLLSLRAAAKEVGICLQTSFRWRHRLLSSLNIIMNKKLGGIIEATNFKFPMTDKGFRIIPMAIEWNCPKKFKSSICISVNVSRGKKEALSKIVSADNLSGQHIQEAFKHNVKNESILISESPRLYIDLVAKSGITLYNYKAVNSKKKRNPYHLSSVIKEQHGIISFIRHFRGVSGKYLQNYLNWYHFERSTIMTLDRLRSLFILCLSNENALEWYKSIYLKDINFIT